MIYDEGMKDKQGWLSLHADPGAAAVAINDISWSGF